MLEREEVEADFVVLSSVSWSCGGQLAWCSA